MVVSVVIPAAQIDRDGLHVSNLRALGRALEAVAVDGSANLVDGFELKHVGVSPWPMVPAHLAAVVELGPSPAHRRSVRCKALASRSDVQIGSPATAPTPKSTKTNKTPEWKSLPAVEKAQHLLDHQTLSDRTWTDEPRLKGEKRDAFIRRILLGEALHGEAVEPDETKTA